LDPLLDDPETGKNEKPLTLRETLSIIIAGHLGVRKREQRVEDFHRASGLRIFIAAAIYFAVIVFGIVLLVRYITA
jgi:hypothetical protein